MLKQTQPNGSSTTHGPTSIQAAEILGLFEDKNFGARLQGYFSGSYFDESSKIEQFIIETTTALSKGQLPLHTASPEDIFDLINQAFEMSTNTDGDAFVLYLNEKLKSTGSTLVLTQERTGIKGRNAACILTLSNGDQYNVVIGPYNPWIEIKKASH